MSALPDAAAGDGGDGDAVAVAAAVADADDLSVDQDCDRRYCETFGLNEADDDENGGWKAQLRRESLLLEQKKVKSVSDQKKSGNTYWVNRETANCHDADDNDSSDLDQNCW